MQEATDLAITFAALGDPVRRAIVDRLGGLHGFMAWDGHVLTDSGGIQEETTYLGIPWHSSLYNIVVADFNGDGRSELVWHHAGNGRGALWNGALYSAIRNLVTVKDTGWQIVGAGDFDRDGVPNRFDHFPGNAYRR